ncbi:hypothetical protein D1007_16156 [Hordeum vulgare]|nr:hypothetical protein D1007_16156 [Hordeum vulgare]
MSAKEEEQLVRRVLEKSVSEDDHAQWKGLHETMALSTIGDIAISELQHVKEEAMVDVKDEDKGKSPVFPVRVLPSPASSRSPRQHVSVPVHQAGWHKEHRVPYSDVTLRHDWRLDLERIPVPAVPQSTRAHAEELRCRRHQLTPQ